MRQMQQSMQILQRENDELKQESSRARESQLDAELFSSRGQVASIQSENETLRTEIAELSSQLKGGFGQNEFMHQLEAAP